MTYTRENCNTVSHEANADHNTRGNVLARIRWCVCCGASRFHFAERDKKPARPAAENIIRLRDHRS